MAWTFNGRGKNETANSPNNLNPDHPYILATETISLGAAKGNRYSSVIDFIPPGVPFTVISNMDSTNTSGSASDQLYACDSRTGTSVLLRNTLRDCNYLGFTAKGTSLRDIDNTIRYRYVDPEFVGSYPYYKIRILQAAVESSAKKIRLGIVIGLNPRSTKWQSVKQR